MIFREDTNDMKIIRRSYLLLILALFFYSYTQVDLNLTLSQISVWQSIQKFFQGIGWFNRPLSTLIYLFIIISLFIYYLIFLRRKLNNSQFWSLVMPTAFILLFSYNAFSYDLFNYLFDARIVTVYHQNPYLHKALDYPLDPWINFMRWTHRTYPYGPVWLGLTVPLSFLGWQIFLPTLFLFKALAVGSYLGTIYFIGKIMEKISPQNKILAMSLFAFNPLLIVESLVSAHNDIVMMFLAIWGVWAITRKKYVLGWFLLFLSIGIKFSTIFLLPVFFFITFWQIREKSLSWKKIFVFSMIFMGLAVIFSSLRTEFQPWYLLWVLPFVFLSLKRWLIAVSVIFSFGLLAQYLPFLYTGEWNYFFKIWVIIISGGLAFLMTCFLKYANF